MDASCLATITRYEAEHEGFGACIADLLDAPADAVGLATARQVLAECAARAGSVATALTDASTRLATSLRGKALTTGALFLLCVRGAARRSMTLSFDARTLALAYA